MRKIAILLPFLILPLLVNAQKSPIDKLFEKYSGKEGFTTVLVTEEMFEVISHMEEEKGDIAGKLGKIKRIRVIAQEDEYASNKKVNFMDELRGVDFDEYMELVVVKNSEQEVLVLAREEGGKLTELLVLVGGEENVLVSIEGKFTMEDLETLSDIGGLEALGNVFN